MGHIGLQPLFSGAVCTLLIFFPLQMPLLAPLMLAAPLPILLAALRGGWRAGLVAFAMPLGVALAYSESVTFAVSLFLFFGAFPLLASTLMRNGWTVTQVAGAAFVLGGVLLCVGLSLLHLLGVDPQALTQTRLDLFREELIVVLRETRELPPQALSKLDLDLGRAFEYVALLFPGAFFFGWFLIQVGCMSLARSLLMGQGRLDPGREEGFLELRVPFWLQWLLLGALAAALAGSGFLRYLGWNLGLFASLPFFFQGLAVCQSGLNAYQAHGFLRGFFYAGLFFVEEMNLLLILVGWLDQWADFRSRFFFSRKGDTLDDPPSREE